MLSNEVRPRRNPGELDRISQWNRGSLSKRVATSKTSESRVRTARKLSGSRMEDRRDWRPIDEANDTCEEDDTGNISSKRITNSGATATEIIGDARKDFSGKEESSEYARCECERIENVDRTASTNNNRTCNLREGLAECRCADECKNRRGDNVRWTRWTGKNIFLDRSSWRALVSIVLAVLLSVSGAHGVQENQCAPGIDTPGVTWPRGDIVLEYGQPLRILCMLSMDYTNEKFPGKNSSDLVFTRNKKELEPEFITVLNESTIALYVEKPPPADDMYHCKLKLNETVDIGVCINKVAIGFKPQEPHNFSCVSHNWENLICSWDPVKNYVTTKYDLVFKLPGRAGGRMLFGCPKEHQEDLPPNTCLWDKRTNPIYRQPYEYYTFFLNVTNFLGVLSIPYKFHHFAHVIPARPVNVSVVNKTLNSTLLQWSVPFPLQNFPPGLHHRIAYQHQWDNRKTWRVINIMDDIHAVKRYYNLVGLEYANTKYDVRVFIKSAKATGEDKWSQFSDVTFRTPSRLPGLPPRTDIGSFEITENNANRDIFLYWQSIPAYLENGDNFKYQISHVEENGRKLHLLPNETTRTYAKFKGISFNSFRFEIVTTNTVGANKENAKIFVPSRLEMPAEPLAFTKIAFDGGLYELSWKPPLTNVDDITNYTIFWCDNERDRPWQCTGYLDWVHVPKSTTLYNVTVPDPTKVYQFAISANTPRASSGMVWASCTVIHNRVVGKMKSVWINRIGSDFIEVGWKLECSDRVGVVESFKIYYCPIVSPYNLNCKEPKLNTTIHANDAPIHGIVSGLKPYTTYMLAVAVVTKNGEGLHSDPLYNTTLEAAPKTPPHNIRINNVTNTSMQISWDPPVAMNGVLRYYEIHYNDKSEKVDEDNYVILKDLLSHKNYSIRVAACTVSCSIPSSPIYAMSMIGKPGKIAKQPNVKFMNSSQVLVRWDEPQIRGGFLDYYQIWSADGEVRNSTKNEAYLPIADCLTVGRERMYHFRVRAVNIAVDGSHMEGPWSDTGEGTCYSDGPSFRVWIIIWVIGILSGLAFLLCLIYTSKRMWLKCKAMQDVEVKLPPGLTPNMKLLQKVGEQHIRQSSVDSSGCSSGQESVTSSLTSDSHVSSDSGADVDPRVNPPSANKLLETAPSWESSSLRQRNVGTSRPLGASNESPRWDSYVKVAKGGEPVLDDTLSLARSTPNLTDSTGGYTASPHAWSSTGYISMPSSEELSSNPSPVPKETTGSQPVTGGYSVVGVVPKPILRTKNDDRSSDVTDTMIVKPIDSKGAIPYVSLASLEQSTKSKATKPGVRDLDDLDDLSFIEPDNLEPITVLDSSVSKPYVQTGLLDTLKKPPFIGLPNQDALKQTDGGMKKPFVSSFTNVKDSKLKNPEKVSKAPVGVGWMPELVTNPSSSSAIGTRGTDTSNTLGGAGTPSSKPYVTAADLRLLQQCDNNKELMLTRDIDETAKKNLTPGYSLWQNDTITEETESATLDSNVEKLTNKRSPSYVIVGENPRTEPQQTPTSNSGYVQHQRFEKQPTQPRVVGATSTPTSTDERYSKVSVAPNAVQ
ncbi:uncharacterized protein dome isoform X2 [Venturia canescens]|uniref:uncharacterized protein dome isoform X2 n=1 Tax=Venturia canescens TaxID=32260 RepID=UPI001C9CB568|nr:uncharacterized protein LOC122415157 isoform X2 [Venturia canescens]